MKNMHTIALDLPLLGWMNRLIALFATDDGSDKTDTNDNDDSGFDDFDFGEDDDLFGSSEVVEEDDDSDDTDPDESDDDTEEDSDEEEDGQDSKDSAIIQKQKYREKLKKALSDNEELRKRLEDKEESGEELTEEEKKEKAAEEYLSNKIKKVLSDLKKEERQQELEKEKKFQDELDEVLEENTDVKEDEILAVSEELGVQPRQAMKVLRREMKLKGKKKPDTPQPSRGTEKVKEEKDEKSDEKLTFDSVQKRVKGLLDKGEL